MVTIRRQLIGWLSLSMGTTKAFSVGKCSNGAGSFDLLGRIGLRDQAMTSALSDLRTSTSRDALPLIRYLMIDAYNSANVRSS